MTVSQVAEERAGVSSTRTGVAAAPDLKALKKPRSAMLTSGTGQVSDELISTPLESNTLTPAASAVPLTLARNISCISRVAICPRKISEEANPESSIWPAMSFSTAVKSPICRSKWRASSSTVFWSSRVLLFSARSRKLSTMIVVPIVMAAIRSMPPSVSQRIGLPRTEVRRLTGAERSAVIGLGRCLGCRRNSLSRPSVTVASSSAWNWR